MKRTLFWTTLLAIPALARAADPCADSRDLRLTNGHIVTFDAKNTIATQVTIQNGRFTAIGPAANLKLNPCTKTIDLKGRTAVPGLIDNHNHIVLLGMRPGHDIRIETATSIAEVQATLKARAKTVPPGAFITTLGDWNAKQFAEKRAPTMAELDQALPNNPYIMNGSGTITNSAGKAFFESKGIMVSPTGVIRSEE